MLCNGTETCFSKFRRGTMIKLVVWSASRTLDETEKLILSCGGGIRQVQEPGGGWCSWVSNTECIGGGLRLDEGPAAWEIPQG